MHVMFFNDVLVFGHKRHHFMMLFLVGDILINLPVIRSLTEKAAYSVAMKR